MNDAENSIHGSITNNSAAPSLISNVRRGSQRSGNTSINRSNYPTNRLDENCSVVDRSMRWEGFSGFYKQRTPFVAERTLSRESNSQKTQSRSPPSLQSSNLPLPTPPRTPIIPSDTDSQHLFNFT